MVAIKTSPNVITFIEITNDPYAVNNNTSHHFQVIWIWCKTWTPLNVRRLKYGNKPLYRPFRPPTWYRST